MASDYYGSIAGGHADDWDDEDEYPAHFSYWGIHYYLTAYRRKGVDQ